MAGDVWDAGTEKRAIYIETTTGLRKIIQENHSSVPPVPTKHSGIPAKLLIYLGFKRVSINQESKDYSNSFGSVCRCAPLFMETTPPKRLKALRSTRQGRRVLTLT